MPTPTPSAVSGDARRPRPANRIARKARTARSLVSGPRPDELRGMYLDLLERAVLHTLYYPLDIGEQPEFSAEAFREALEEKQIELKPIDAQTTRAQGRDWPQYAQTMVGAKRLRNVRRCVQEVLADGVEGDLIETGCWRGGVVILMRGILAAHGVDDRDVYVADSFQGVPKPDAERYPADAGDLNYTADDLAVSADQVRDNFRRYGLLDEHVKFLEGWFADTLPTVRRQDLVGDPSRRRPLPVDDGQPRQPLPRPRSRRLHHHRRLRLGQLPGGRRRLPERARDR